MKLQCPMNEMRLVNGQSNGSVQAVTYSDKFSGYSDIPFSKDPSCACSKDETEASSEENDHEDDVYARRADHVQHIQAGACDKEKACKH